MSAARGPGPRALRRSETDVRTDSATIGSSGPDSPYVAPAVEVFAMLADATRVRLILALLEGEMPVGALAETVDKPVPAVSQHLAKMRLAAMVASRQEGNRVFYRLINDHAARLVLEAVHQAEHATSASPSHHARD